MDYDLFDPYRSNFNIPNVTTILIDFDKSSMDVDVLGSHGNKGTTRVVDENDQVENHAQPSTTPFDDVAQEQNEEPIKDEEVLD